MEPERFAKLKAVLDRRQPDLTIITDQVNKQRNLSAIMRSCDAFGVPFIHTVERDDLRTFAGVAASAQKWVNIIKHTTIESGIEHLQERGFKVYAAHLSDRSAPYHQVDFTQPTAILMGAEIEGVSSEALAKADGHIIIPMKGMVESFNVSVAASLILAEAIRQREQVGMLDQRRLSDQDFNNFLFEWLYGRVAKQCREADIPYPQLTDTGEMDEAAFEQLRKVNQSSTKSS